MADALQSLTLRNERLQLEILPAMGGKIATFQSLPSGQELLQQPLSPYAPRTRTMPFDEGEASGYDECIPSVADCEIKTSHGPVQIPDHGDFWRLPFETQLQDQNTVVLEAIGFSLPLRFRKTFQVSGDRLLLSYQLENIGSQPVPYLWSAHPGFAVDPGDRIVLPSSVKQVTVEWSAGGRLGSQGTHHSWPRTTTASGSATDLGLVGTAAEQVGDKLFTGPLSEAWCTLQRARLGLEIHMTFDHRFAHYLGVWISYGGWPPGRDSKQFCVALEPCTAPTDSLAVALRKGWARTLDPKQSDSWQVELQVRNIR